MKNSFVLLGFLFLFSFSAKAVKTDSLSLEKLLQEAPHKGTTNERVLFFAQSLLKTPYVAGTLEQEGEERLVVSEAGVDCTTFVELVSALSLTREGGYEQMKKELIRLRYANGIIDGYASRLHYFSQWVEDNKRKGLVEEITNKYPHREATKTLNFMSTHASLYNALRGNTKNLALIEEREKEFANYRYDYIPKEWLNQRKITDKIKDGAIIALVTNKAGLDVSHLGFAIHRDNTLHLLHASQKQKEVVVDPLSLYEYLRPRKDIIGIRVVSLVNTFTK